MSFGYRGSFSNTSCLTLRAPRTALAGMAPMTLTIFVIPSATDIEGSISSSDSRAPARIASATTVRGLKSRYGLVSNICGQLLLRRHMESLRFPFLRTAVVLGLVLPFAGCAGTHRKAIL